MMPNGPPAKLAVLNAMQADTVSNTRDILVMATSPAHSHWANAITGCERGNNDAPLNQAQVNELGS
jgi:hypothetical protein